MKTLRDHLFWIIPLGVVLGWYFVHDFDAPLDLSEDEPPFNSMAMPLRSVKATTFMDGGSVWVITIDQEGRTLDFAFPYHHSGGRSRYPTAYYGANHAIEPGAIAFKDPNRAKKIVLSLLDKYREPGDEGTHGTYFQLGEQEPDLASKILHKALTPFNQ